MISGHHLLAYPYGAMQKQHLLRCIRFSTCTPVRYINIRFCIHLHLLTKTYGYIFAHSRCIINDIYVWIQDPHYTLRTREHIDIFYISTFVHQDILPSIHTSYLHPFFRPYSMHTYLPTYLPSYLPTYLPTLTHTTVQANSYTADSPQYRGIHSIA